MHDLTDKQSAILTSLFDGESIQDIQTQTGLPKATVLAELAEALELLRLRTLRDAAAEDDALQFPAKWDA